MKILHGTSAVSIKSTRYLCDALNKMGHRADILIYFNHPFASDLADYNLMFVREKYLFYPIYFFKALKMFFFSMKKYDLYTCMFYCIKAF